MPTYGEENFKESNINYLNKDFTAIKSSLINYARSYFPDTYRDFNETSPGMMLLEMNAYVGDVLSFYIDQQYRELLLPLAEERRNIITMAKMFGYKVKPIVPAYVDLTFTSDVNAASGDASKVDYSNAAVFDVGIQIVSSTDSNVVFSTLEPIDFQISGAADTDTIALEDESGLASSYTLSRTVKAVSATEKSLSFQIDTPEKFKTIVLPDKNVIDIISCIDSNGDNWYEVDFLAQDKVPIPIHYTDDINRDSAYSTSDSSLLSSMAVPYSLTYITTTKRFTRETNLDNTTSLVFGNGILKNGQVVDEGFINTEQIGIVIPGQTNDLNNAIDPLLGDEYSTLGETPNNTTLTITYRVGGGITSNVNSNELITLPTVNPTPSGGNTSATLTSVTNINPAIGGKDEEDTTEIKEKAKAFFSTQNRCVTKEDYEARIMNMQSKFGNVAKVYVTRAGVDGDIVTDLTSTPEYGAFAGSYNELKNRLNDIQTELQTMIDVGTQFGASTTLQMLRDFVNEDGLGSIPVIMDVFDNAYTGVSNLFTGNLNTLSTINIYVLGYNNRKQLIGNPHYTSLGTNDNIPPTLMLNIKKYLENFKILTDTLTISDGYIVNFGVIFDVIAEKYADKQKVKLDCIQKIKDYFRIEKMQFNQPIYKSQLEFELMGVEGVRSIGHVTLTQYYDYFYDNGNGEDLPNPTYTYSFQSDGETFEDSSVNNDVVIQGYGYKYDFKTALSDDGTIVLPPLTSTPTVFELKNPNTNIRGRVR